MLCQFAHSNTTEISLHSVRKPRCSPYRHTLGRLNRRKEISVMRTRRCSRLHWCHTISWPHAPMSAQPPCLPWLPPPKPACVGCSHISCCRRNGKVNSPVSHLQWSLLLLPVVMLTKITLDGPDEERIRPPSLCCCCHPLWGGIVTTSQMITGPLLHQWP